MFRQCSFACLEKAVKKCLCSNQFFCLKHCEEHTALHENHCFIDIFFELNPGQRTHLIDELSSRLTLTSQCKSTIEAQTASLINKIQECSANLIKRLSNLEFEYQNLMETKEYSENQIEYLKTILQTELQLKINPYSDLVNSIEQYFSQDFYLTAQVSKMKGFLKTHTDRIFCVAATKNQKTLFSGGHDNSIKIWNTASKRIVNVLEGHSNLVTSLALSIDNCYIVSGSHDNTVRVWCLGEMKEHFVLKGHTEAVLSVAVDETCKWIASGSFDGSVRVWSFDERRIHTKLFHNIVRVVAFRPMVSSPAQLIIL
jgi:WD40 repeat protein